MSQESMHSQPPRGLNRWQGQPWRGHDPRGLETVHDQVAEVQGGLSGTKQLQPDRDSTAAGGLLTHGDPGQPNKQRPNQHLRERRGAGEDVPRI